jgi:hypothetical protein
MNDRMILQLPDAERETIADTDVTLEKTPYVVRAIGIGTEGSWNGIVYFALFDSGSGRGDQ